jgi:SAM-dependent methyltransferase
MSEIDLLRACPRATRKMSSPRSLDPENGIVARRFGREYFDGKREQGYGGYRYDGRWIPIARDIAAHFGLAAGMRVLDVGSAKGFLAKDLMAVCPGLEVYGIDISHYAISVCEPEAKGRMAVAGADLLPFADGAFDVVLSINTLHNLDRDSCRRALAEIMRVGRGGRAYVQVDAYTNPAEREIFMGWVLTAKTFLMPEEWRALFAEAGYRGDHYWTILAADPAINHFGAPKDGD